jgi:hypothetical protein
MCVFEPVIAKVLYAARRRVEAGSTLCFGRI